MNSILLLVRHVLAGNQRDVIGGRWAMFRVIDAKVCHWGCTNMLFIIIRAYIL